MGVTSTEVLNVSVQSRMGSFIILMHFGEISTLEWKVGLHVVLVEAVPSAFRCNINVAVDCELHIRHKNPKKRGHLEQNKHVVYLEETLIPSF